MATNLCQPCSMVALYEYRSAGRRPLTIAGIFLIALALLGLIARSGATLPIWAVWALLTTALSHHLLTHSVSGSRIDRQPLDHLHRPQTPCDFVALDCQGYLMRLCAWALRLHRPPEDRRNPENPRLLPAPGRHAQRQIAEKGRHGRARLTRFPGPIQTFISL